MKLIFISFINLFKNLFRMNRVILNNHDYGNVEKIEVTDNKVFFNGIDVTPRNTLRVDIKVEGDIDTVKSGSGDITCNNVKNSLTTGSGDVSIKGDVFGDLKTGSGDIEIGGEIHGNIVTGSGDVNYRKLLGTFKSGSGKLKT